MHRISEPVGQRAIIHVDMDAFYASVEQADQPALRGLPVIVGGLGPRGVVAAASYEARRSGVRSAMPMYEARRRCPEGRFLQARMSRYREISQQVFAVFAEVTPLVEGLSLDEAFLDVSGSLRLFGSIEAIGERLRQRIRERTGLSASVGMAHNKFLAKLASAADKPDGFVTVQPDRVREFLDPLPIDRLWGLGRKTAPLLRGLGLYTIGQLRCADAAALRSVLGNRTGHFLALAAGLDKREVSVATIELSISQEITFDTDLLELRELQAELQRQAESVARRLRAHQLMARTVQLKVRDHAFRTHTRSFTLAVPTQGTRSLFRVLKALLERWLAEHRNTPVRLLGAGASSLEDVPQDGMGPEAGSAEQVQEQVLDRALDDITRRFGDRAVSRALGLRSLPHGKRKDQAD